MAMDHITPRSRRALLTGALGGIAALAASAARPLAAAAAADGVTYVNDETSETVLEAQSTLAGIGVRGVSAAGIGVQGVSDSSYGVQGVSGSNNGVYGCSGSGIGVHGGSGSNIGVFGASDSEVGVHGESVRGRGGRFMGGLAQVTLVPADTDGHPDSGSSGDLFVDGRGRLWFCRGGSDWSRLA